MKLPKLTPKQKTIAPQEEGLPIGNIPPNSSQDVFYTIFKYAFIVLCVLQFASIAYINLSTDIINLGHDAALTYTRAIEIWKESALNPSTVRDDISNLHLDTAMPFAALLYGLTGNIFISYGIVNIFISLLIALMFILLLRDMQLKDTRNVLWFIVPLTMLFSPYVGSHLFAGNPLDDFYSLLYISAAFWGFRLLTGLFCIKAFTLLYLNGKLSKLDITIITTSVIMFFICSVSSGIYLFITFSFPMGLFLIYKYMMGFVSLKSLFKNKSLYLLLLWMVIALAGRSIADNIFEFAPRDSPTLVTAHNFFSNLGSVIVGFLLLMGAVHYHPSKVLSTDGVVLIANLFIVVLMLLGLIFVMKSAYKKKIMLQDTTLIFVFIIFANFLIFALTSLHYGSPVYESRYLIPIAVSMIAILCVFLSSLDLKPVKNIRTVLLMGLLFALVISNIFSFREYKNASINDHKSIAQALHPYSAELVYTPGLTLTLNLRVLEPSKIFHQYEIDEEGVPGIKRPGVGEYTHHTEPNSYRGEIILVMDETAYFSLSDEFRSRFVFSQSLEIGGLNVYLADDNYLNITASD